MTRLSEPVPMERAPGFVLRKSRKGLFHRSEKLHLHCENIPLAKLAERYGTPLYVYSATAILHRLSDFRNAFHSVLHTVCYSVKANSNVNILRLLARQGCGFDVVSGGELERVLVADRRAAKKVVFSGVGKSREEMTAALKAGILLFNVESESELWALAECAAQSRKVARIALRVNPDVAADTHPYISTGLRKHKFGVPIRNARELYAKASVSRYLKVAGVSVHIGSQITDIAPFAEAVDRIAALVRELRADGHRIDYVDAGGGLGIDYQKPASDFADDAARYARAVANPLRGSKVHLLLEPGRAIVGPAGVLLTSVIYRKQNGSKHFLVVDAAMNDLNPASALRRVSRDCSGSSVRGIHCQNGSYRCGRSSLRVGRFLCARSRLAASGRGRFACDSGCGSLWNGARFQLQLAATACGNSGSRKVSKGDPA